MKKNRFSANTEREKTPNLLTALHQLAWIHCDRIVVRIMYYNPLVLILWLLLVLIITVEGVEIHNLKSALVGAAGVYIDSNVAPHFHKTVLVTAG